jgi:ribonuclease P protein component
VGVQQKRRRLSRSAEFDRVYRHGRSVAGRNLVLYVFPRSRDDERDVNREPGEDGQRLGVSVGRRVGGAVARNKVKRALREGFWSIASELPADHDYVIVARQGAQQLVDAGGSGGVRVEIESLLEQLGWKDARDGEDGDASSD